MKPINEVQRPLPENEQIMHGPATEHGRLNRFLRSRPMVASILAGVCIGAGSTAAVQYDVLTNAGDAIEEVADLGVTVTPSVSSSGTEALISGNDLLRDAGTYALLSGILAVGVVAGVRRRSDITAATFTYLAATKEKGLASKILPAAIISSVGLASGLGDTAGKGANEPVRFLSDAAMESTSATKPGSQTLVVTQHARAIPFNHSELKKQDVTSLNNALGTASVNSSATSVVPFIFELGDVYSPSKDNNPSSAPIVALPNSVITKSMGVNLAKTEQGCSNTSVIVGKQLGAKTRDTVIVEGRQMKVARTVDIAPGLDRVAVIGSLEQLQGCIFDENNYSGALVLGMGSKEQLQAKTNQLGINASARELDEYTGGYDDFWDRSVKPVEMNLILLVLGVGFVGVSYMRSSNIDNRRKIIATMLAGGVDARQLGRAESIRSLNNSIKAAGYSILPTVALTAVANSSQYGLDQSANIKSLGAGYLAYMGASMASDIRVRGTINKIDPAQELRS